MDIPHSKAELSSDWLTMALRLGQAIGAGAVTDFVCSPLDDEQGAYGQLVRVALTYDSSDTGGPRTLVAKFSSANSEMRHRPNTKASYAREVRFYQEMAQESPLPVPTCYYADVDTESGWHVVLLEDLAPARSGSTITGCSVEQARTAIHHIAHFHAHWWENPRLNTLENAQTFPADAEWVQLHEQWWPAFLQKLGKPLPGEVMEIGEALGKHRGRLVRHLFSEAPSTLIHADYHLENMMFGAANGKRGQARLRSLRSLRLSQSPFSFFVVDWQFVKRGRGIWDVAYFLSGSLEPADRKAIEMDLLKEYLGILRKAGTGTSLLPAVATLEPVPVFHGVQDYSLDDAMHDYRISLLHRFGALISTIAAMPFSKEQIRATVEVSLPRIVAALLEHDCRSLLD